MLALCVSLFVHVVCLVFEEQSCYVCWSALTTYNFIFSLDNLHIFAILFLLHTTH
uniref:Uncharacterized protein n=1 Tax=Anguilla anguilla TaxID=7936 RepID=A0A0E9SEL8_ANGAN